MAPRTSRVTRNPDLIRGIGKFSKSQMYHKRGIWAIKAKNGGVFPRHDPKPKPESPAEKPPKFYPADDVKKPLLNKHKPKPTKLRVSITPGTVLIILAGRFKGKRAPRTSRVTRNPDLIRGIGKFSKSQMYHKRGIWAIKAKNGGVFPRHDPKPKPESPAEKPPKFYPADDVKKPLLNKHKPKPTKLRASILPGTVLIILAGRFKGKRVVFLKQLPSGLLLVTGPFKINGVPLRRVNQAYVIGTSTKVDISGVNVNFDDKYFSKEALKKKTKGEGEFFESNKEEKKVLPQQKKDDQKTVDATLIKSIESVPDLKTYLAARFSLKSGVKPHELLF